jgi:hypothetical protein
MGRHEIRLRRKRMTSRRIQSHKDYNILMEKHRKTSRWKRLIRSLVYILILLGMFLLIYFGVQKLSDSTDELENDAQTETTYIENISRPGLVYLVKLKPKNHGKAEKPPNRY